MKVIGKTNYGYILEATEIELANLEGEYSILNVKVGDNIEVSKVFNQVRQLRSNPKTVKLIQEKLEYIKTSLEEVDLITTEFAKES